MEAMNEQIGSEDVVIAAAHGATLDELKQRVDVYTGLYEITELPRQHQVTMQTIEGGLDLNAGLNDIVPGFANRSPSRRSSRNSHSSNDLEERFRRGGPKTHALALVDMVLEGMESLRRNLANQLRPSNSNRAERASRELLGLKAGIDDGSMELEDALTRVRQAVNVMHNFYADELPTEIALTVNRTLRELRQLEAIIPKLFKDHGSEARSRR